jgi:glycosyltransferase involved in cell wall biosynthesis
LLDYPHSGTAVYTRNLASRLPGVAPDLSFRLYVRDPVSTPAGVPVRRLTTPFAAVNRAAGLGARLDKLTWEVVALPIASAFRREALLHSLYLAAPMIAGAPVVVTVHDLIGLALPNYHRTRQSELYNALMVRLAPRARAIITVSQHSREDIVRLLNVPPHRVHVTYEAVEDRFTPDTGSADAPLRDRYGLPDRFILYVGSAERRKNLTLLVRAWSRIARQMRDREVRLVVVAHFPPPDRLYPDVPALVSDLRLNESVLLLDHVDESDKPALYRAALATCFPSIYEGFGFPPLESMSCGTPVLASHATSIPEVVGDAGLLLPPDDEAAWATALLDIADSADLRDDLRRRGLERAARFSWDRAASETAAVYREVLG